MWYIDSGEDYYELPSSEAHDALLNPRQSSSQLVDVEVNVNVASNVDESRTDAMPEDEDDWNLGGAAGLDEVERVCVKRRFRDFQESCHFKRRKVPGTVTEVVELADELDE